jgi:hypothetical protein
MYIACLGAKIAALEDTTNLLQSVKIKVKFTLEQAM